MAYIVKIWVDEEEGDEWELDELPEKEELEKMVEEWFWSLDGDWGEGMHEVVYVVYHEEELLLKDKLYLRVPKESEV